MRNILHIIFILIPLVITQPQSAALLENLNTDKARYTPGEKVVFNINVKNRTDDLKIIIKYFHLNNIIEESLLPDISQSSNSWNWLPPGDDFKGYITEVVLKNDSVIYDVKVGFVKSKKRYY